MNWTPRPKRPSLDLHTVIRRKCSGLMGDGYHVAGHTNPLVTTGLDIAIVGDGRSGVMYESESSTRPAPSYRDDVLTNCRMIARPRNALTRWPRRGYGFEGECETSNVIAKGFIEHWYDAIRSGRMIYRNVWLEALGGNGLQLRLSGNRHDPDWVNPKEVEIHNLALVECGQRWGEGRAAFAGSFKTMGPNARLWLNEPFIQTIEQENVATGSDGKPKDSFGGPCFEYWSEMVVDGGVVEMKNPKNGLMQLYDMAEQNTDLCAPVSFTWNRPRSWQGGDIHVSEYTKKLKMDAFDGPGYFVIHKRDAKGVWKAIDRVPFTAGLRW